MKVTSEKIPESQVVLQIEVEPERVEKALDRAYRRLAQRAKVPGFRPGKAPRAVVERYLGPDRLMHEALDRLLPEVYREALDEQDITPVDLPELEVLSHEPLTVKATVPVRPTVDIGDYESLRVEKEAAIVADDRVEAALEDLRHRYAVFEPVERPVQWDDVVRADVSATADGEKIFEQKDVEFRLRQGATVSLPGFAEKVVGLEKGKEAEVEVEAAADNPDARVAGKTVRYSVLVKEVKAERLPELDDTFAKQVGEDFPTLTALRDRLLTDLQQQADEEALHRYHDKILAEMDGQASIEFPPVLVEREIDHLIEDRRRALAGIQNPERFVAESAKPDEEVREELRSTALGRIRRSLILTRVAEVENMEVGDEEVEAEIERMTAGAGPQQEQLRGLFADPERRDAVRRSLLTRKTLARLVDIASGGETPEDEAKEE